MSKWLYIILFIVTLITARWWYATRFMPVAYTQDEAALLLNAELLAETGKDEWNQSWPVVFRSFGDSKLPGYIYSIFVTGKLIGFSWETVRLPSQIAGILLPIAVWWLVRRLGGSDRVGIWVAAGILISPWSWHYGSTGYEAHLGLLLWIMGVACFAGKYPRWWLDLCGGVLLALSILTYNAPLLLFPALLVAVALWRWPKKSSIGRAVVSIMVFGGLAAWLTLSATAQKSGISIFQDPTVLSNYPAYRASFSGILQTLLGNQWVYFARILLQNWFASWGWSFLVNRGGANPWNSVPVTGHINGFLLVLLGLVFPSWVYWLGRTRHKVKQSWSTILPIIWLLGTALTPAMITVDAPHATRSLFFFVMLTIFVAFITEPIWLQIQNGFPTWARWSLVAMITFLIGWHTLLWVLPAQVRWTYYISPRWNQGLIEALEDPRVQEATRVYIHDSHGTLYPYVALTDDAARARFLNTVGRSGADTVGLYRVQSFERYFFVSQPNEIPVDQPGLYLKPRSNTQWDIIESSQL